MTDKNLAGKNLDGADLRGADLAEADLRGASLIDADLRDADLTRADLRGANLARAKVAGAKMHRTKVDLTFAPALKGHSGVPDWASAGTQSTSSAPARWTAADRPIACPHCAGDTFVERSILLNTRGLTFFELDWLNDTAAVLECTKCSRLEWFAKRPANR
jgi:hypothetical protein